MASASPAAGLSVVVDDKENNTSHAPLQPGECAAPSPATAAAASPPASARKRAAAAAPAGFEWIDRASSGDQPKRHRGGSSSPVAGPKQQSEQRQQACAQPALACVPSPAPAPSPLPEQQRQAQQQQAQQPSPSAWHGNEAQAQVRGAMRNCLVVARLPCCPPAWPPLSRPPTAARTPCLTLQAGAPAAPAAAVPDAGAAAAAAAVPESGGPAEQDPRQAGPAGPALPDWCDRALQGERGEDAEPAPFCLLPGHPLLALGCEGQAALLARVLEQGADPDARDSRGLTGARAGCRVSARCGWNALKQRWCWMPTRHCWHLPVPAGDLILRSAGPRPQRCTWPAGTRA